MNRPVPPAFALIELFVVVVIFAVLVGLPLPAAQKDREATHLSCSDSLQQTGGPWELAAAEGVA